MVLPRARAEVSWAELDALHTEGVAPTQSLGELRHDVAIVAARHAEIGPDEERHLGARLRDERHHRLDVPEPLEVDGQDPQLSAGFEAARERKPCLDGVQLRDACDKGRAAGHVASHLRPPPTEARARPIETVDGGNDEIPRHVFPLTRGRAHHAGKNAAFAWLLREVRIPTAKREGQADSAIRTGGRRGREDAEPVEDAVSPQRLCGKARSPRAGDHPATFARPGSTPSFSPIPTGHIAVGDCPRALADSSHVPEDGSGAFVDRRPFVRHAELSRTGRGAGRSRMEVPQAA